MYERVWQEIKYEALTNYISQIKSKTSITKTINNWQDVPTGLTKVNFYNDYINNLLLTIADCLKERISEETSVLIIPNNFILILAFGPLDRPQTTEIVGPYFAGILNRSVTVIVDPTLHNSFYAYNITNPDKVLKLEIK